MTNKQLAAYHEAGHVVMALVSEFPIVRVSIEQHFECGEPDCWIGATEYGEDEYRDLPDDGPEGMVRYIILCASGVAAEDYANGGPVPGTGAFHDELAASQAAFVLAFMVDLKTARSAMTAAPVRATEILTAPAVWAAVAAVADALVERGKLTGQDVADLTYSRGSDLAEARGVLYRAASAPLLGR